MRDPSSGRRQNTRRLIILTLTRRDPGWRGAPTLRGDQLGSVPARPSRRAFHRLGGGYAELARRSGRGAGPCRARRSTRSAGRPATMLLPASRATTRTDTSHSTCSPWLRTQRRPSDPGSAAPPWLFPRLFNPSTPSAVTWPSTSTSRWSAAPSRPSPIWGRCCWSTRWGGESANQRISERVKHVSRSTHHASRTIRTGSPRRRPSTLSPSCPSSSAISWRWMRS